jgi:hypothetical protein
MPNLPHPFRIAKLELQPGDMVVLQTDLMLDKEQITMLRDRADEQFRPLKAKVAILTSGLRLGILRKADAVLVGKAREIEAAKSRLRVLRMAEADARFKARRSRQTKTR